MVDYTFQLAAAQTTLAKRYPQYAHLLPAFARMLEVQLTGDIQGLISTFFPHVSVTEQNKILQLSSAIGNIADQPSDTLLQPMELSQAQMRGVMAIFGIETGGSKMVASALKGVLPFIAASGGVERFCVLDHGENSAEQRYAVMKGVALLPNFVDEAAFFLKEHIMLPHANAALSGDISAEGVPGQVYFTHSYGALYSMVGTAMTRNHLLKDNPPSKVQQALLYSQQINLGMAMPVHDNQGLALMPALHVVSEEDFIVYKGGASARFAMSGDIFTGNNANKPFVAFHDAQHPHRIMVVVHKGILPVRVAEKFINVGAHGFANYTHGLLGDEKDAVTALKPVTDVIRGMMQRDKDFNFGQDYEAVLQRVHGMLGSRALNVKDLAPYQPEGNINVVALLEDMLRVYQQEELVWQTAGNKDAHPLAQRFQKVVVR